MSTIKVGCFGIVSDDDRCVILVKKRDGQFKDLWMTPGGGMEHGEDVDDTIRREVMEETGLRVEVARRVVTIEYLTSPERHVVLIFKSALVLEGVLMAGDDASEAQAFHRDTLYDMSKVGLLTPVTNKLLTTGILW